MTAPVTPLEVFSVSTVDLHTDVPDIRTPVICTSFDEANRIVRNNEMDLCEAGTYEFCVIQKTFLDKMYPDVTTEWWYGWNATEEEYLPLPHAPEPYYSHRSVIHGGFCIG